MAGEIETPGQPPLAVADSDGRTDRLTTLAPGTCVGKYEILAVLGQGGFGITYRARDTQLDREVAIKEYLPTHFAARQPDLIVLPRSTQHAENFRWGRERFLDEAKTLARLEDAIGIVNVHDFLEAYGTAYMVMALVRGETLEAHLKREGRLTQQGLEQLLHPLLDGLELVHAAGFLHRDIKPANILIDASGRPTLIDFGASRMALQGRSQAMTAVFTPGYAAFEQVATGRQGPWTDIFGLAATLYHAVAGVPPPSALERMAEDTLVPAVEAGLGRYRGDLLRGIDAGLRLKAADRPQSIGDWRRILARASPATVTDLETPVTRRMDPPSRAVPRQGKPRQRRRYMWAAAAAVTLCVASGGAYLWLGQPVETAEQALLRVEQEVRRQSELAARLRQQEEARRAAEAERLRRQEEARKAAAEKAAAEKAEAERQAAEAARLKAEAEARRRSEEETRARKAAEDKAAAEAAARRKAEEEAKARAEAEARRKAEEEARARKAAEEKAAAEAAARRKAEEEAKARAEAEAKRKAEEEARARKAAEEKAAAEAAARRKAEEEAKARAEAEAKRKMEEEARALAWEETVRRAAQEKATAEAAARRKAEDDSRRAEEETRRKADDEAKARAEAEARRKAEEEARARKAAEEKAAAEAAARRKAEEEARALAWEETVRRAVEDKAAAEAAARRKDDEERRTRLAAEEKRQAEVESKRQAETMENALRLSEQDRKRIQVALTALGFDTQGIDGAFGPRTRQMISRWQRKQGASETGYLTAPQLAALRQQAAQSLARYEEDQRKLEDEKRKSDDEAKRQEEERKKVDAEAARRPERIDRTADPAAKREAAAPPVPGPSSQDIESVRWSIGTWEGQIYNFFDLPGRLMQITLSGDTAICTWAILRQPYYRTKSCVITGTSITLTTGADTIVKLQRSGDRLTGTFQISNGRIYMIEMTRSGR